MTQEPKDKARAARGAAHAAIGKLIGDDQAVRRGEAEKAKAAKRPPQKPRE